MFPSSFNYSFLAVELLIFRTMHSSPLCVLEWNTWNTGDYETSAAEIGDVQTGDKGTSESKIAFLSGLDTFYLLQIEH